MFFRTQGKPTSSKKIRPNLFGLQRTANFHTALQMHQHSNYNTSNHQGMMNGLGPIQQQAPSNPQHFYQQQSSTPFSGQPPSMAMNHNSYGRSTPSSNHYYYTNNSAPSDLPQQVSAGASQHFLHNRDSSSNAPYYHGHSSPSLHSDSYQTASPYYGSYSSQAFQQQYSAGQRTLENIPPSHSATKSPHNYSSYPSTPSHRTRYLTSPTNYNDQNIVQHRSHSVVSVSNLPSSSSPTRISLSQSTPTFTPTSERYKKSPQEITFEQFQSPSKVTSSSKSDDSSSEEELDEKSNNPRKAKKSTRACEACRKHHRKCDGGSPCLTCINKGAKCVYTERKKRGPKNEVTKKLRQEVDELKQRLQIAENERVAWEQRFNELARMINASKETVVANTAPLIPVPTPVSAQLTPFTSIAAHESTINALESQLFAHQTDCNQSWQQQSVFLESQPTSLIPTAQPYNDMMVDDLSNTISKKRKNEDESCMSESVKKVKMTDLEEREIENLDLTNSSLATPLPRYDDRRFALCSMITRFITLWEKFVHPFHSLLPVNWESAMPDFLIDLARCDSQNSENKFFLYSLLCNSARSIGDLALSRDLHSRACELYPLHKDKADPRVGNGMVLLSYYSMSVGDLTTAMDYAKQSSNISDNLEHPQLNLQMNSNLCIASISDSYEERRVNFRRLGQTKQICDVIMSVTGEVQNEITHGETANYKELIAKMADLLKLKNISSANVTLMHEVGIYGILILCLHKSNYKDLALNYGRKLLEIAKDPNFKHCCIGTTASAIAEAASMFLDFESFPEFYECIGIMDELSIRYELAGIMKRNVEEKFLNPPSNRGSSSGSEDSPRTSPNNICNIHVM